MSLVIFNPQGINKLRETAAGYHGRLPVLLGIQILVCDFFFFILVTVKFHASI
jgi:hypothetical protein